MTRGALVLAACVLAGFLALALGRPGEALLGSYATSLEGRTRNQRHNAELAVRRLTGAVVDPGSVLSFNRRVGSLSMDRGFRKAPVSYNGQLIDSWGGGVCQVSTTLYNAALLAGLEVVERSRHRFAPGYVPVGLDAAVAFDGIDLKLRNPHPFPVRIDASIVSGRLVVRIYGARPLEDAPRIEREVLSAARPREFHVGNPGAPRRVRNTGKVGAEVAVYRVWRGQRELVSVDTYPVMHRIVEGD
ncbi:MAG: VanW family protein [Armatimonadetes bacterium]|jgi:vancomycin resistance protein VanW|nr:VanW family protein [Armatimonadota bacterium]MCA1995889.1 VanW family protein [Armatimonadota bacterium]